MFLSSYVSHGTVKRKNLISLYNVSREDLFEYVCRARDFKRKAKVGEKISCLADKYIALIVKNSYFRSRVAFQVSVEALGGKPLIIPLSGSDIEDALKDKDVVHNLRDYGVQAFIVDTLYIHDAETLEHYAQSPIINANAKVGPCHAIATLLTLWEKFGKLSGLRFTYIGDCTDFDNSILIGAAKCGININIVSPENCPPSQKLVSYCKQFCDVELYADKEDGVRGSDIVFVAENDFGEDYAVDELDLAFAHKDAVLLHSFPLNRGTCITDDAVDCAQSLIFEQSANIIPALEAVLSLSVL